MRTRALIVCFAALACASWQRAGGERASDPASVVPRLFDPTEVYRGMGLFAARDPLAFVASVRFVAGASPDSTLAVVGVSMANSTLSFRRTGDVFQARYRVDVAFRDAGRVVQQFSSDEAVRVGSFGETQRSDESVIFQRFIAVPPGTLTTSIAIRDLHGDGYNHAERVMTVPRLGADGGLSELIPVYRAAPRPAADSVPTLVVNPRGTVPYGADTISFYIESYGPDGAARVIARALVQEGGEEVWRDSLVLDRRNGLAGGVLSAEPELLPVGELQFEAFVADAADTVRTSVLVSFSDAWAVSNLEQTLSLLRYFGHDAERRALADAAPEDRPKRWRELWDASDPNPATPENEVLDSYFVRLDEANERFREGGRPGWLTDRGEVYISLGEPDEIFDSGTDIRGRRERVIRWNYFAHRLALDFVDETGSGLFRLTPSSRAAYLTVLDQVRRSA